MHSNSALNNTLRSSKTEHLDSIETLDNNDPTHKIYTRVDFLCHDVSSIQSEGNKNTMDRLKRLNNEQNDKTTQPNDDEVESWQRWKVFPISRRCLV